MKKFLSAMTAVAMVLGVSGAALAQGVKPGMTAEEEMSRARAEALSTSMADLQAKPFGDIPADMNMAEADRAAWMRGLTPTMQGELAARCDLIQQNSSNFEASVVGFCSSLAIPPAGDRPSSSDLPAGAPPAQ